MKRRNYCLTKLNKAVGMKKKDAPTKNGSHHYPPFADIYAGFMAFFLVSLSPYFNTNL